MFGDVHVTKNVLRWRTALILRELEEEIAAARGVRAAAKRELAELMDEKEALERRALPRSASPLQRQRNGYGAAARRERRGRRCAHARPSVGRARRELDARIAPLAKTAGELDNSRWGLLMRAGNDKSNLARQVERYADIYTSRVSNFLRATPFFT